MPALSFGCGRWLEWFAGGQHEVRRPSFAGRFGGTGAVDVGFQLAELITQLGNLPLAELHEFLFKVSNAAVKQIGFHRGVVLGVFFTLVDGVGCRSVVMHGRTKNLW